MPPQDQKAEKNFIDVIIGNAIASSVIIAALIISASVLFAAHMITGGVATGTTNQPGTTQAPSGPVKIADRSGQPVLGNANAPVTIYEFSDFQCPFCQSFFKNTLSDIVTKYINTGKAKLVYRYFPLSFHVNAEISAEAGECANLQGKFWTYHDVLFTNGQSDGTNLDSASLKKYANQIGLNMITFNQCLDNHQTKNTVVADQAVGSAAGVTGTPTFYINGTQIVGAQPAGVFEQAIEGALKK